MSQLDEINKLFEVFEARADKSERRFYKREPINFFNVDQLNSPPKAEVVGAIAIHIPEHRIDDFLSTIDDRMFREIEIRNRVPAVKMAYERYKLLLAMCKGDYNA